MKGFETLKMINNPALDAIRELQASNAFSAVSNLETTGAFEAVKELQKTFDALKPAVGGATVALEEYQKIVAPLTESIKAINTAYAPVFEQTKVFDSLNFKGIVTGLQTSSAAMSAISGLNLSGIASIVDALPKYDFLSDMVSDDFSVDVAEKLYESGEITQDDINEELSEIVSKKQFSPKAEWDKFKKSKWFFAINIIIALVMFVCDPVIDYATEKVLDELGINKFWEDSGVYDSIYSIFEENESSVVSETEAKENIDKTKTGNISKQRREDLLSKIKDIRTFISSAPQDENTGNLLLYLSDLEKDINGKKYGLVFEEHREEIDEVLSTHTPVLTEESDMFIDNGGEMNFLIEGDNLASLQLLEKTHKGKIDLIYIDPPYNTGNADFIYDDNFVSKEDNFRHSLWCSFMTKRLETAKKLLSPSGVIFISIDDNEYAALKFIADKIFGHENYEATITYVRKTSGKQDSSNFAKSTEYILVYSRASKWECASLIAEEKVTNRYNKEDENGRKYRETDLRKTGNADRREDRPLMFYPFYYNPDTNDLQVREKNDASMVENGYVEILPIKPDNTDGRWRWGYQTAVENKGNLVARVMPKYKEENKYTIYEKDYIDKKEAVRTVKEHTCWDRKEFNSDNAMLEFKNLGFSNQRFSFPKSSDLIKHIIYLANFSDCTVLDFFAGSGTTGQAVLRLNAEDGGNRKFILCTNNENDICREVTYERIKRVIDKEGYAASLKYYKVNYIPVSERMYYEYADELLCHIRELVELENGVNFTGNAEISIVLTEEELDEFIANADAFVKCHKLYMGHDILPSEEQEETLKRHNIEISIIPDYYYRNLQEN